MSGEDLTSRVGPGGMDARREPRTIDDLLDDRKFEYLLWDPKVLEALRRGREAMGRTEAEIRAERELGIRRRPWSEEDGKP